MKTPILIAKQFKFISFKITYANVFFSEVIIYLSLLATALERCFNYKDYQLFSSNVARLNLELYPFLKYPDFVIKYFHFEYYFVYTVIIFMALYFRNWFSTLLCLLALRLQLYLFEYSLSTGAQFFCLLFLTYNAADKITSRFKYNNSSDNPHVPLKLMIVHLAVLYFCIGWMKSLNPAWWNGTALYAAINYTFVGQLPFEVPNFSEWSIIYKLLSWSVLGVQIIGSFFLLTKFKSIVALLFICFHIGVLFFMGIGYFSIVAISFHLLLLPNLSNYRPFSFCKEFLSARFNLMIRTKS